MRVEKVDLNLFVVMDVIYRERNLTRVAEVLHVTQPTVSNALARLRKSLNDELFIRTPEGMMPTPLTENIIGRVRDGLQTFGSAIREGDVFDLKSCERRFRLSLNDVAEALILPDLMRQLNTDAPMVALESYYTRRKDLSIALSSGQLEMAVDVASATSSDLYQRPLFKERYVCAVREGHPMAADFLTLEQYLDLSHIHVSNRRSGLGLVDLHLRKIGHQRRINLRLSHYLVVRDIVLNTDLALSVPSQWVRWGGMKMMELPFEVPEIESHLFWHKSSDGDEANRWLRERIVELSAQLR